MSFRNRASLNVEQLESRWNPADLIWNRNPLFAPNWSIAQNWLNPATEAPPTLPPQPADNVLFTGVQTPCFLDVNATVNSIIMEPFGSSAETFVLHVQTQTLRIEAHTPLTHTFVFGGGTVLFSNPVGHLVLDNVNGEWSKGDFLGGTGTVELKWSTTLKIKGQGEKFAETLILVGTPSTGTAKATLLVAESTTGSINLGHAGKLNVTNKGEVHFFNSNAFTIDAIEENPYTIDLDGSLMVLGGAVNTINVGITMDASSSQLILVDGGLIVDDLNNNLSVNQSAGETRLLPFTILDVRDGFDLEHAGSFTLLGDVVGQGSDNFITKGDFYFEGTVNLVQQIFNNRTINWSNQGELIFGDDGVLVMNVSGGVNQTDIILADVVHLGGQLIVNENVLVQQDMKLDLIGARTGLLTGMFDEMLVNGNPLEGLYEINHFIDQDNYHWFQIEKL